MSAIKRSTLRLQPSGSAPASRSAVEALTVLEVYDVLYRNATMALNPEECRHNGVIDSSLFAKNRLLQERAADIFTSILYAVPRSSHTATMASVALCSFELGAQQVDIYEKWQEDQRRYAIHIQISTPPYQGTAYLFRKLSAQKLQSRVYDKYLDSVRHQRIAPIDEQRIAGTQHGWSRLHQAWRYLLNILLPPSAPTVR